MKFENLIDKRLCRWMYTKGWTDLNEIQQLSFMEVYKHEDDIIISASTASGKTEAAFLPILSYIAKENKEGYSVLYISPLKALINDQWRRLEELCEYIDTNITPWHGDISDNKKKNSLKNPKGILLITPESLESLLLNNLSLTKKAFKNLDYIVIDEFHTFMGSPRGTQLKSLLHRVEFLINNTIPRIALSATFSQDSNIHEHLRPNNTNNKKVKIIKAIKSSQGQLAVQIRGYDSEGHVNANGQVIDDNILDIISPSEISICKDIFKFLRGSNNLIFADSKKEVEKIAEYLKHLSESIHVPNEFFPHHGSLAKNLRQDLEARLQEGNWPTTAICTATLELGIDISDVASVGQINCPLSVAALRQRLGRSGRRDGKAVLRMFVEECYKNSTLITDDFCEQTIQAVAIIALLLEGWYEPPKKDGFSLSILIQQILSVIASYGSASAISIYNLLCKTGPFYNVSQKMFASILRDLATNELITQLSDKSLAIDIQGERLLSKHDFYTSFEVNEEFTVEHKNTIVGRVPAQSRSLAIDNTFLLAGRGWRIVDILQENKRIIVVPYNERTNPISYHGEIGLIEGKVREKMKEIYETAIYPNCLNKTAKEHLEHGISTAQKYGITKQSLIESKVGLFLFPFVSDMTLYTISMFLKDELINNEIRYSHLELEYCSKDMLKIAVSNILAQGEEKADKVIKRVRTLDIGRHDKYLSRAIKELAYIEGEFDVDGALSYFKLLAKEL